jgi:hypothetical protein
VVKAHANKEEAASQSFQVDGMVVEMDMHHMPHIPLIIHAVVEAVQI